MLRWHRGCEIFSWSGQFSNNSLRRGVKRLLIAAQIVVFYWIIHNHIEAIQAFQAQIDKAAHTK